MRFNCASNTWIGPVPILYSDDGAHSVYLAKQGDEFVVMLDGKDLAGVPPYRRPSNMMFQSYALFPHMDVEANIAFGLKQEGMPKDQIAQRVAEMLAMVKLLLNIKMTSRTKALGSMVAGRTSLIGK